MENLYESLHDDVISDNPTDADNIGTEIIRTVNGHVDHDSLSNDYNIGENNSHINTALQAVVTTQVYHKITFSVIHFLFFIL